MTVKKSTFRFDINALRAIAVVGVLLFHFKIPYFSGGFTGVDIFFVISGYLMTKIVHTGIVNNNFSYIDFYGKRLKRIVPALVVLLLVVTVLGFFVYLPGDYRINEKNVSASLLFISNIFYWKSANYFAPNSDTNVLLHTWSLSVEWQFYMIYPLILILFNKLFKSQRKYFIVFSSITLLIFFISVIFTKYSPGASFYLLPFRSWEMLFGGVAFFSGDIVSKLKWRRIISIFGYLVLLLGFIFLNNKMAWPGFLTMIPVIATFAIIVSNVNEYSFLRNSVIQFFGKISYSLYLWHWPVYVFANYLVIENTNISTVTLIVLSILLGYLSFRYIESLELKNKNILVIASILMTLATTLALLNSNNFLFKPFAVEIANYEKNKVNKARQFRLDTCFIGGVNSGVGGLNKQECLNIVAGKRNVLLIGDSHAAQFSLSLRSTFGTHNVNLIQATSSGCLPILRSNGSDGCSGLMKYIYDDFLVNNASRIDGVIIGANWNRIGENGDKRKLLLDIAMTLTHIKKLNIPVIVIGQNEVYTSSYPSIIAKEYQYGINVSKNFLDKDAYVLNAFLLKGLGSSYIDIINSINFPPLLMGKIPYMFDENHFTEYGADLALRKILANPSSKEFFKRIFQ